MLRRQGYKRYLDNGDESDTIPASTARRMRIREREIEVERQAKLNDPLQDDVESNDSDGVMELSDLNATNSNEDSDSELGEVYSWDSESNSSNDDDLSTDPVEEAADVPINPDPPLIDAKLMEEGSNGFRIFEILLMVLSLAMRHSLSYAAMQDILELISLLLCIPQLPKSKYLIKKIFNAKKNVNYHFVCNLCNSEIKKLNMFPTNNEIITCSSCDTENNLRSCNMFLTIPLVNQIESILECPEAAQSLLEREVTDNGGCVNDITSGDLYNQLKQDVGLQSSDITLTFNADGMQKFKSNYGSIWCILAYINELPSKIRTKEILINAIWFGTGEPCMQTFFNQFVSELNDLQHGFTWKFQNVDVLTRVFAICCCVDSKARSPILNMVQFNGYYGCIWCYHPGHNIKTQTNSKGTVKYTLIHGNEKYSNRSDEEIRSDMANASMHNTKECGLKGVSILSRIPHFNLARGVVVDYMHCVLLGVMKAMITLWLKGDNLSEYYLKPSVVSVLDDRLMDIKVNRTMHRRPRKISEFCHWKASEYKNFLLYFSLPLLLNILPLPYYNHLHLLVSSVYLLMQEKVSVTDLDLAERNLYQFVIECQDLYGNENMTYNIHQLLHLTQSVRDLGPLWAHSCFSFESFNGLILKLVHGPIFVVSQISNRFNIRNAMNKLFVNCKDSMKYETLSFLTRICEYNLPQAVPSAMCKDKYYFYWPVDNSEDNNKFHDICAYAKKFYTKGLVKGELVVGTASFSKAKNNDSFIQIDNTVIEVICLATCNDSQNVVVIGHVWTVHQYLDTVPHIFNLVHKSETPTFFCIDGNQHITKYVLIECAGLKYICKMPNRIESE